MATDPLAGLDDTEELHARAVRSLFELFETLCEGAIAVDAEARVVWINDRYLELLGLAPDRPVLGLAVEELIPNSLLRQVIEAALRVTSGKKQAAARLLGISRQKLYDRLDRLAIAPVPSNVSTN